MSFLPAAPYTSLGACCFFNYLHCRALIDLHSDQQVYHYGIAWPELSHWPLVICDKSICKCAVTGSGKTYTLAGDLDNGTDPGLLGRSIKHVAQGISKITDGSQFKVGFPELLAINTISV